jgi:hypothetical protein
MAGVARAERTEMPPGVVDPFNVWDRGMGLEAVWEREWIGMCVGAGVREMPVEGVAVWRFDVAEAEEAVE